MIKRLDKATEEGVEQEFFDILQQTFEALNDMAISLPIVWLWFEMRLLDAAGRSPNLDTDESGEKLVSNQHYVFNIENMTFQVASEGRYVSDHIKLLRLARDYPAQVIAHVTGSKDLIKDLLRLLEGA